MRTQAQNVKPAPKRIFSDQFLVRSNASTNNGLPDLIPFLAEFLVAENEEFSASAICSAAIWSRKSENFRFHRIDWHAIECSLRCLGVESVLRG